MIINHLTEKGKRRFETTDEGEIISFGELGSEKTNGFLAKIKYFYWPILAFVIATAFFFIGRLSAIEDKKTPLKIYAPNSEQTATLVNAAMTGEEKPAATSQQTNNDKQPTSNGENSGRVIGSKSGKKYYYPWCGTVSRIKPENQVIFASIESARAAGYLPGGNCKGLR